VTLEVFDVGGRRVRTLLSGWLSAGRHRATWDGKDERGSRRTAGLYFYRASAWNRSAPRRMILVP
jgi:flagellar hook assembly protein FlgD